MSNYPIAPTTDRIGLRAAVRHFLLNDYSAEMLFDNQSRQAPR